MWISCEQGKQDVRWEICGISLSYSHKLPQAHSDGQGVKGIVIGHKAIFQKYIAIRPATWVGKVGDEKLVVEGRT